MKIRLREHAKFQADKMAKIALAATPRVLLDLYALEPGQAQKVHSHDAQDKIYVVLEGRGRFSVGGSDETLEAGRGASWRPPAPRTASSTTRPPGCWCSCSSRHRRRTRDPPLRASFMVTCLGDMFYPEVGERIVRLLRRLGVTVEFPADQTCCGLPLFNSGSPCRGRGRRAPHRQPLRRRRARRGAVGLLRLDGQARVPRADGRRGGPRGRRARWSARTHELSQFLVNTLGRRRFHSAVEGPITYHDSCHLLRGLHESQSPRTLLRELAGARFVELAGRATSAAASAARSRSGCPRCPPPSSTRSSPTSRPRGADCVVACDAGCLMQMRGGLSRRGSRVRALHLAEVLDPDRDAS